MRYSPEKRWWAGEMRSVLVPGTEVSTAVGSQAPAAGDCGGLPGRPALPALGARLAVRRRGQGTAGPPVFGHHPGSLPCVVASSTGPVTAGGVPAREERPPRWLGGRCMPLPRARGGHREHPPLVRDLTAAGSKVGQGLRGLPGTLRFGSQVLAEAWVGSTYRHLPAVRWDGAECCSPGRRRRHETLTPLRTAATGGPRRRTVTRSR